MQASAGTWLLRLLLVLLSVACAQAQTGAAHKAGSPVAPPARAKLVSHSQKKFATYPLIIKHVVQLGGIEGNIAATRTVEGALTRHTYRVPGQDNAGAVIAGYAKRLKAAGFKPLFKCAGKQCGPTFVRASPGFLADPDVFDSALSGQHYLAVRRGMPDGDVYVAVQSTPASGSGVAVQVDRLKVKPREVGAISINAAQMAEQLQHRGRVVLYGIYFDFDSAKVKPGSKSTLAQIAKLMKNKPKLRLLVVGHTDSRGSFDYNIKLSTRRAKAVVDALVSDYGVARDRLKPWGVGYSAPRTSNSSGAGRAKNRRVELVPW